MDLPRELRVHCSGDDAVPALLLFAAGTAPARPDAVRAAPLADRPKRRRTAVAWAAADGGGDEVWAPQPLLPSPAAAQAGPRLALAVVDRAAGTVCLARGPAPLLLRPVRVDAEEEEDDGTAGDTNGTAAMRRRALVDVFGAARNRLKLRQQEENRVSSEGVVGAASISAHIERASSKHAQQQSPLPTAAYLPPFNATASDPAAIYDLSDLVYDELAESVRDDLSSLRDVASDENQWHEWASAFAVQCAAVATHKTDELRLLVLSAIVAVVRTFQRKSTTLDQFCSVTGMGEALATHVLPILAEVSGDAYTLPRTARSRAISYALILALSCCNYKAEMSALEKDLGLSRTAMMQHLRSIGCKVSQGKKSEDQVLPPLTATLTAPLKLPATRKRRLLD